MLTVFIIQTLTHCNACFSRKEMENVKACIATIDDRFGYFISICNFPIIASISFISFDIKASETKFDTSEL